MIRLKPEKPKVTVKPPRADLTLPRAEAITVTKRGRPATGKAMTNAQRQAKFKAIKKAMDVETARAVN